MVRAIVDTATASSAVSTRRRRVTPPGYAPRVNGGRHARNAPASRGLRTGSGSRGGEAGASVRCMPVPPTVTLRTRVETDLDVLYRLAAELETWEERSPSSPAPLTRAAFDERLADRDGSGAQFVIEVDGQPIGQVSLFAEDGLARHAEVGIGLLPEARGRGIGSAAIAQIIEFAFVRRNLRRLHLEAIESNIGAIRVYERAGFVIEGRQREHAWVRGGYEDIVRMGLLRSEWQRGRPLAG